jgi:hypothetical protein
MKLYIPGGKDQFGVRYPRFPIRDRHDAYEWSMALADRHPYDPNFRAGDEVGVDGEDNECHRLTAIKLSPKSAAIYRAINTALDAGDIAAIPTPKPNWFTPPLEPGPTRRLFDVAAIVKVLRELGASGPRIDKLLAMHPEPRTERNFTSPRPTISDDRVRSWYKTRVKECTKKGEQPSEAADWKAARDKFGEKIRRDSVRCVRQALAPAEWRRRGRRSKDRSNSAE